MKKKNNRRKLALLRAKIKGKEKGCLFCKTKTEPNWQEYEKMREFLSPQSKIINRQFSGVCVRHQKRLAREIKHARHLALLPFVTR